MGKQPVNMFGAVYYDPNSAGANAKWTAKINLTLLFPKQRIGNTLAWHPGGDRLLIQASSCSCVQQKNQIIYLRYSVKTLCRE